MDNKHSDAKNQSNGINNEKNYIKNLLVPGFLLVIGKI